MPDCLIIVERGGYQSADLATGEFRDAATKAFQIISKHVPAEIEALCSSNNSIQNKFHEATEVEISLTSIALGTSLSKMGVDYVLFDDENIIEKYQPQLENILASQVKFLCISTTYLTDIRHLQKIINFFHARNKDLPVIIGGQVLDVWGDNALKKLDNVFCYCYGDMDISFGKIVSALLKGESPDKMLTRTTKGEKSFYTIRENISDLDTTYFPDWELLTKANLNNNYYKEHQLPERIPIEERRGCPNKCAFCSYRTLNKHRQKSPNRIVSELTKLKKMGYSKFHFIGSEFLAPAKKSRETLKLIIKNKLDLDILCYARIDMLAKHPDLIELMAEAGVTTVYFGVESGDQTILKNMNKNYNIENIPHIVEKLKQHSINVWASFIFGFPGETQETINNTANFIKKSKFETIEFHALQVIPDTPLYTNKDDYQLTLLGGFWSHPTMSLSDVPKVIRQAYTDIFPHCDSSISNINDSIGKYFILKDSNQNTHKKFEKFLNRLIYIQFCDTITDKEALTLEVWHEMKKHIKSFPKSLLTK